mmetsp:Transcript_112017/g.267225  ORF Transcript_112017/g.267225 Transcript_112017/m.267225 type:complete len:208 (+) Transcript_112017:800-1423(+)
MLLHVSEGDQLPSSGAEADSPRPLSVDVSEAELRVSMLPGRDSPTFPRLRRRSNSRSTGGGIPRCMRWCFGRPAPASDLRTAHFGGGPRIDRQTCKELFWPELEDASGAFGKVASAARICHSRLAWAARSRTELWCGNAWASDRLCSCSCRKRSQNSILLAPLGPVYSSSRAWHCLAWTAISTARSSMVRETWLPLSESIEGLRAFS